MRQLLLTAIFSFSLFCQPLWADEAYSTAETDIGTLMDDPNARAILKKYMPKNISDPQFSMARMFTLTFIQAHDRHGELTDENLDKMDAEFAKLAEKE